jgi:tetratricopeptide (TPR) repeat protein
MRLYQIKSRLRTKEDRSEEAESQLDQAAALAEKLNLGEETFRLNLKRAELYLDLGDTVRCREFLDRAGDFGPERCPLLRPMFHLISGRAEEASGNARSAQKEFETALGLAEKLGHPETIWQIRHRLGRLLLSEHDVEGGYGHLKSAGSALKRLTQGIQDPTLRQMYLKDPKKRDLLSDLQKAARELVGKTPIRQE